MMEDVLSKVPVARPAHAPGARPMGLGRQFGLAGLWFGNAVAWLGLSGIVLPHQISAVFGHDDKEFYNGVIPALGALVALVAAPVAGALSDRSTSRHGRRAPFMVMGTLLNVTFLVLLGCFGAGGNPVLFTLCFLVVQLGANWAGGPYAALVPEVVPQAQRGELSGILALMGAVGALVGALVAGHLVEAASPSAESGAPSHGYFVVYLFLAVTIAAMATLTLLSTRETPDRSSRPPFSLRRLARSMILDRVVYRDFYWVLLTRAFINMGLFSCFNFFQFFLADIIHVQEPAKQASYLLGTIIVAGIPSSVVAGRLSDRMGRKPLVYASGAIMAVASLINVAVALHPSLEASFVLAALFGIGSGAFQAVDWALAIDTLPVGEDTARDMGVWQVAMVVPGILGPALTGLTLRLFKETSLLTGYNVVFVMSTTWFILGTVFVRRIRGESVR